MLVQVDKHELGDKRLDPKEAVCREREDLLKLASTRKIDGQAELEDPARSGGAHMHHHELIRRLLRCNPALCFKDGIPGNVAVYIRKKPFEYEEADYHAGNSPDAFFTHHRYVTGFELKPLPQWSHVRLDTSHLPTREVRGWRSVLIALIKARAFTYSDAVAEFGDPILDQRSTHWFKHLQKYK